jgi:hypothetical protein
MIASHIRTPLVLVVLALWGCATDLSPTVHTPAPFFQPTSEDNTQLAALASELDTLALDCAAEGTCEDRVHFARGLVSLFENREAARASFEQVISLHPSSALAGSSALWLELLQTDGRMASQDNPQQRLLMNLTAQSVRDWVARQGISRTSPFKAGSIKAATVHALHKQVQDRDRHIAELRAQLEALKVIDQDQQERHRKMRTPASVRSKEEKRFGPSSDP